MTPDARSCWVTPHAIDMWVEGGGAHMVAGERDKAFTAAARKHMLRQQCWVTPVRWMTEQLLSLLGGGGWGRWWCRIVGETLHWSTRAHAAGNLSSID